MTFKVLNLGSKQPYFNSVYVVRVPIFSFTTVVDIYLPNFDLERLTILSQKKTEGKGTCRKMIKQNQTLVFNSFKDALNHSFIFLTEESVKSSDCFCLFLFFACLFIFSDISENSSSC